MSRRSAPRALTLPEELEKLEQSITLTLQEIDSNFSKAHRIVTSSILPIVEQYAKHSNDVWEGSKFWKSFFEASANVSLSGYEEAALEDDVTHTADTLDTPTDRDEPSTTGSAAGHDGDEEDFSIDSPTQVTGVQSTPKLPPSTTKRTNGKAAAYRSPSPRKYTGGNPLAREPASTQPSTPRPLQSGGLNPQSSPFEPESAYQPSARQRNPDPLMHRAVLDKNYRIQATPHTQRRQKPTTTTASAKPTPSATTTTTTNRAAWEDSPDSSPAIAAPQLRSDLFSPAKPTARTTTTTTPGISVLTPARNGGKNSNKTRPTTSTGRQLFSPEDKAYSTTRGRTSNIFLNNDDDDSDDDDLEMSPPKTMAFHVPQSRLMRTPAREASRKIVEDLLLTAGADVTDDEDEGPDEDDERRVEEPSPSVVRRAFDVDEDTF